MHHDKNLQSDNSVEQCITLRIYTMYINMAMKEISYYAYTCTSSILYFSYSTLVAFEKN